MATKQSEHPVAEATFAPFMRAWHLGLSMAMLWFTSVAILMGYVYWNNLDGQVYVPSMIDFYIEGSNSKELVQSVAMVTYVATVERLKSLKSKAPSSQADQQVLNKLHLGHSIGRGAESAMHRPLEIAAFGTVLFAVRLTVVVLTLPFFCLLVVAGLADGLVQRYVRKACAGHESAAIYHRAKRFGLGHLPSLAGACLLCWPEVVEPAWLLVPAALTAALLIRIQATYYKKYL